MRVDGRRDRLGPPADTPAGECGVKDQVSRTGARPLPVTFTGRGLPVSEEIREQAEHKLTHLQRLDPRTMRLDLELVAEHHPSPTNGLTMIKASLSVPRKTFHAHAEAPDVRTALDDVAEKLERQIRDHRGKRLARWRGRVRFARRSSLPPADMG